MYTVEDLTTNLEQEKNSSKRKYIKSGFGKPSFNSLAAAETFELCKASSHRPPVIFHRQHQRLAL